MTIVLTVIPLLIALAVVLYWRNATGGVALKNNTWMRAVTMLLLVAAALVIGLQLGTGR